jgi:hypothetical protein
MKRQDFIRELELAACWIDTAPGTICIGIRRPIERRPSPGIVKSAIRFAL